MHGAALPPYVERTYREISTSRHYSRFSVKVSETDLYILADSDLTALACESVHLYRSQLEEYIRIRPEFGSSLVPLSRDALAPGIVKTMLDASLRSGVGPMASVAGAIAEYVGRRLLEKSANVVVENGGDIFLHVSEDISVGIFAGASALSGRLALKIRADQTPLGICTSSGTVGHSLSFGSADAVCIKSKSAALADAAATATGNVVKEKRDVRKGLSKAMSIEGVLGVLIVIGDILAVQGDMEIVRA
ncbi:MAG: hypothetical protein A4E73_02579 [Syntrophaceae bacterium PtaU1.Bin231]|nr:MAG: hypothetical protein A4E73_02579 [Syntrophaceae bacterium PtaU1.Bin231]